MKKRKARRKGEPAPTVKFNEVVRRNYDRKEPTFDYLKNLRVVRYWAKRAHGVGLGDLEMLLFLYSERLFKRTDFNDYQQIFSWNVHRFEKLLRDGWISIWRKRNGSEATLYEVSYKGKKLISSFYKKLSGEEIISETPSRNPIFKKNSPYTDKVYKRAIENMNEATKQRRRLSQE